MSRLSPLQKLVLEHAAANDGLLYRWRGGYWTTVPQLPGVIIEKPRWYARRKTILSMIKQGVLVPRDHAYIGSSRNKIVTQVQIATQSFLSTGGNRTHETV